MAKIRRTSTRNTVSGALRSYIHLQKRTNADDGWGNTVPGGSFSTQFSVYANFRPLLRGSATGVEAVYADKLQGNQPYIITARYCNNFKNVTTAWRVVDARDNKRVFNIISPPSDITDGDRWVEFIVVLGKNDG